MQLNTSADTVLLPVTHPACTVLIIDYAAVNIRGVSQFSPPIKWTGNQKPTIYCYVTSKNVIVLKQTFKLSMTHNCFTEGTPTKKFNLFFRFKIIMFD